MAVCLSVCLCVTPDYVETAKYIVKLFSPSRSHTVLVFPYQTLWQYSGGIPQRGRRMQGGYEKNRDFRPISGK